MDFRLAEVHNAADWIQAAKRQGANAGANTHSETAKAALAAAMGKAKQQQPTIQNVCSATLCSANATLRCSRCKQQYYCSAKCQKTHWKEHKAQCKAQ